MFRNKKNEEQLPKAMRQMQKEKEERENSIIEITKNGGEKRMLERRNRNKERPIQSYWKIIY